MKLSKKCRTRRADGYTNYYHRDGWLIKYAHDGNRGERWFDDKQRYHRENGPAIIYDDGDKVWYLHGCHYPTEQLFNAALLKLKAEPNVIASNIASFE